MTGDLILAVFIIAVGVSVAGAGTYLYQMVWRAPAALSYAGSNMLASLGNLAVSFVCGPYIMLMMGWSHDEGDNASLSTMMIGSFVAFGWAFITGLLFVSLYLAVF